MTFSEIFFRTQGPVAANGRGADDRYPDMRILSVYCTMGMHTRIPGYGYPVPGIRYPYGYPGTRTGYTVCILYAILNQWDGRRNLAYTNFYKRNVMHENYFPPAAQF